MKEILVKEGQSLVEYIVENANLLDDKLITVEDNKEFGKYTVLREKKGENYARTVYEYKVNNDVYRVTIDSLLHIIVKNSTPKDVHFVSMLYKNNSLEYLREKNIFDSNPETEVLTFKGTKELDLGLNK